MKIRLLIVAIVLVTGCAKSEPVTTKAATPPAEDQLITLYQQVEQRQPEPPVSKPGPVRPNYVISYEAAVPSTQAAPERSTVPDAGSTGSKTQFESSLDFKGAER